MITYDWFSLDEEGRYGVWSEHLLAGGREIDYSVFCDTMDDITERLT